MDRDHIEGTPYDYLEWERDDGRPSFSLIVGATGADVFLLGSTVIRRFDTRESAEVWARASAECLHVQKGIREGRQVRIPCTEKWDDPTKWCSGCRAHDGENVNSAKPFMKKDSPPRGDREEIGRLRKALVEIVCLGRDLDPRLRLAKKMADLASAALNDDAT